MARYLNFQHATSGDVPVTKLEILDAVLKTNDDGGTEGYEVSSVGEASESTLISKEAFDAKTTRTITTDMPFEYAIGLLKLGYKLTRRNSLSWRTTARRSLNMGRIGTSSATDVPFDCPIYVRFKNTTDPQPVMIVIEDGEREQYPWTIALADILADDWVVFSEANPIPSTATITTTPTNVRPDTTVEPESETAK
jgi:hypothetical protein